MNKILLYVATALGVAAGFALGYRNEAEKEVVQPPPSMPPVTDATSAPVSAKAGEHPVREMDSIPAKKELPVNSNQAVRIKEMLAYPSWLHMYGALKTHFDSMPLELFPVVFDEYIKGIDDNLDSTQVITALLTAWSERAPKEGAPYLKKLPEGWRESRMQRFMREWGKSDVISAREWCNQNLTGVELYRALRMMEEKPQSKEAILAIQDSETRAEAIQQFFLKKAGDNRPQALLEAVKLSAGESPGVIFRILSEWVKTDPSSAMLWVKTQDEAVFTGSSKADIQNHMFQYLVQKDPAEAKRFAAELPPGSRRSDCMSSIASQMLTDDPSNAISYFDGIAKQDPGALSQDFFKKWLSLDPEKASKRLSEEITRIHSNNQMEGNDWMISGMMEQWRMADPAAAAKFTATLPDRLQSKIFGEVAGPWVSKDVNEAVKWAQELPAGNTKDLVMQQFAATWARHDTSGSAAWLNTLPQDSARWAATRGVAASTIDNDPDKALTLVRSISNEAERMKVLAKVWQDWSGQNKTSAEDWLKNSKLSEAERAAITIKQ